MVQTLKEESKEENEEDTGRKFEKTQEDTAVRRSSYTQKFLHTEPFAHRHFYTQKLLQRGPFTY